MPQDYLKELMKKAKQAKDEKSDKQEKLGQDIEVKKEDIDKALELLEGNVIQKESGPLRKGTEQIYEKKTYYLNEPKREVSEKTFVKEETLGDKVPETQADKEAKEAKKKKILEQYGEITIYKIEGKEMPYYVVPSPRPTETEKTVINTIKEVATRVISINPYFIRDPEQRRVVYKEKILEILSSAPELKIPKARFDFYANAVVREMVGYGLIDQLVRDDGLEEIMVIGAHRPVYVFHRKYEMMKTNVEFISDEEINDLINRIGREIGRRVDFSNPLLDARLPDGSRVNATIAPASVSGSTITIRKFRKDPYSLIDLVKFNTLSSEAAAFLWVCTEGLKVKPANILISGGTGSGKTTLLNVLASVVPNNERIVTIEDTAELNLPLDHWVRLEARPPGLEGRGELTLDILTKNSLIMRPDRIIVGEIRHDEAFSLFTAMNTGHAGSLGTVHANSAKETLVRVTSPPMNVPNMMLSGLDLIIVEHRIHDKKLGTIRRVIEISEVSGVLEGRSDTMPLFEWNAKTDNLERTSMPSNFMKELEKYSGLNQKQLLDKIEERKRFIEMLIKKDTHDINQVKAEMELFLNKD